jgi:heme/copper-type cytochrome/quinol oxidase subunit 2
MRYRNIVFVIIMSIFTLGIYDIYWAFSTRSELVKKKQKVPSPWIVLLPLLGLVFVMLLDLAVSFVKGGNSSEPSPGFAGNTEIAVVVVGMISVIGVIPVSIYWLWKYCKAVERVTNGELTTGFNFSISLLMSLCGVWVLWPPIVQYQYNKLAARKSSS